MNKISQLVIMYESLITMSNYSNININTFCVISFFYISKTLFTLAGHISADRFHSGTRSNKDRHSTGCPCRSRIRLRIPARIF